METNFGLNYHEITETTIGHFFLASSKIPSNDRGTPWHLHTNEDEWILVISGTLRVDALDKQNILKPGEHLKIPKGEWHRWLPASGAPTHALFLFSPAGIEKMFRELVEQPDRIGAIRDKHGTVFLD
jgi:mannose-6-phosphate isomerase-like protein (cupin superfamily)